MNENRAQFKASIACRYGIINMRINIVFGLCLISCAMSVYETLRGRMESAEFWLLLTILNYLNFKLQCMVQDRIDKAKGTLKGDSDESN